MEYQVVNITRSPQGRLSRASNRGAIRHTQYILDSQLRMVPGRPALITQEDLDRNLDELREKSRLDILEVRTLDGRRLNLDTLTPEPSPALPPLPTTREQNDAAVFKDLGEVAAPAEDVAVVTAPDTSVDFGSAFEGATVSEDEDEEDLEVAPVEPPAGSSAQSKPQFQGKHKKFRR